MKTLSNSTHFFLAYPPILGWLAAVREAEWVDLARAKPPKARRTVPRWTDLAFRTSPPRKFSRRKVPTDPAGPPAWAAAPRLLESKPPFELEEGPAPEPRD